MKTLVKQILRSFNVGITRYDRLDRLEELVANALMARDDIELLLRFPEQHTLQLLRNIRKAKSQLGQDLFVLSETNFKQNGFFVEFGAADGAYLSNTYLLEKEFGWDGILAEPAKRWHQDLKNNRTCRIDTNCVWKESGELLNFNEVDVGEFSTINAYSKTDSHREARRHGRTYDVKTISLADLLAKYGAPKEIDFLSIDTEGSEYDILSNFDFTKYSCKIITCEHNFTQATEKIFSLLTAQGYVRKYQALSKCDDWYVKTENV